SGKPVKTDASRGVGNPPSTEPVLDCNVNGYRLARVAFREAWPVIAKKTTGRWSVKTNHLPVATERLRVRRNPFHRLHRLRRQFRPHWCLRPRLRLRLRRRLRLHRSWPV